MKSNKGKMVWLLVAVMMLVLSSVACDNDKVDATATATPTIDVQDNAANEMIDNTIDAVNTMDGASSLINDANCKLGFTSCITDTEAAD